MLAVCLRKIFLAYSLRLPMLELDQYYPKRLCGEVPGRQVEHLHYPDNGGAFRPRYIPLILA